MYGKYIMEEEWEIDLTYVADVNIFSMKSLRRICFAPG